MRNLVAAIGRSEKRFRGTLCPSGSYWEGLKVGLPDEFDYTLILDELSVSQACRLRATEENCLLNVLLETRDLQRVWQDCLSEFCLSHNAMADGGSYCQASPQTAHRVIQRPTMMALDPQKCNRRSGSLQTVWCRVWICRRAGNLEGHIILISAITESTVRLPWSSSFSGEVGEFRAKKERNKGRKKERKKKRKKERKKVRKNEQGELRPLWHDVNSRHQKSEVNLTGMWMWCSHKKTTNK